MEKFNKVEKSSFRNNINKWISLILIEIISIFTIAQDAGYMIVLDSEKDEVVIDFKRKEGNGVVGIVNKSLLSGSYNNNSYLYTINSLGDTSSIKFTKQDTAFNYYYIEDVTSDASGFLLIGNGIELLSGVNSCFTIFTMLDNENNIVWEKTYNFGFNINSFWRASLLKLSNGDFLYACSPNNSAEMYIQRLSSNGDSLDFKPYFGEDAGYVVDLTYNTDSTSILLSTEWAHYVTGGYVSSIITFDDSINQIDVNYYPEWFRYPFNVLNYNSKLLVGGREQIVNLSGLTEKYICAYTLDSSLNILNEFHLTNPDTVSWGAESRAIDYYNSNCIFLGGTFNRVGILPDEPSWMYISKLNDTLGVEYEKYIGGDYKYWLHSVTATADGGVLLAACYQDYQQDSLNRDALIIKIDSSGLITGDHNYSSFIISDFLVYPNPGAKEILVRTAIKDCIFNLYDINGKLYISEKLEDLETTIKTKNLYSGKYPYIISKKNKRIYSGIWIKK